jgi:hypothetical protein
MGDVLVETAPQLPTPKQQPIRQSPVIDSIYGLEDGDTDEYSQLKKLQRQLEYDHFFFR